MKTQCMCVSLAALATLALVAAGPLATAQTSNLESQSDSIPFAKVSLAGLDLGGQAGASVALRRIHHAAESVCGVEPATKQFELHGIYVTCVNAAVDRAVAKLGSPTVSMLNSGSHEKNQVVLATSRR
jgi:UrcA family protein